MTPGCPPGCDVCPGYGTADSYDSFQADFQGPALSVRIEDGRIQMRMYSLNGPDGSPELAMSFSVKEIRRMGMCLQMMANHIERQAGSNE